MMRVGSRKSEVTSHCWSNEVQGNLCHLPKAKLGYRFKPVFGSWTSFPLSPYILCDLIFALCLNSCCSMNRLSAPIQAFCRTTLLSVQFCLANSLLYSTNTDLSFETQFKCYLLCKAFPKSLNELTASQHIYLQHRIFELTSVSCTGLWVSTALLPCTSLHLIHRNHSNICWWVYKSNPQIILFLRLFFLCFTEVVKC